MKGYKASAEKVDGFIPFCISNNCKIFIDGFLLNQDFERFIYIERFHIPFLKGGENDAKFR